MIMVSGNFIFIFVSIFVTICTYVFYFNIHNTDTFSRVNSPLESMFKVGSGGGSELEGLVVIIFYPVS